MLFCFVRGFVIGLPCPYSRFCLQYVETPSGEKENYYIKDIQQFKQNLYLFPLTDKV